MRRTITLSLALIAGTIFAQDDAPASPYYDGFNFDETGTALKTALASKITTTHVNELNYQQAENALKVVDLEPGSNYVLLIYGFSDNVCPSSSADDDKHRKRYKNSDGGGNSCEWNREHVFPKSLGNPDLGETGPGADAQHLRAADVDRNSMRGNSKYAAGSGNSGAVSSGWYPGDEWKGDAARIIMYMYLRYGNQCLPKNAVSGSTVATDANMSALLLQWNAEDPVSEYEDIRNTYLGNANNTYGQGNRNPFIDNPYLATLIWGGPVAQDRWGIMNVEDVFTAGLSVYPNPAVNNEINIYSETELDQIQLINVNGQMVQYIQKQVATDVSTYKINNLPQGFYMLKLIAGDKAITRKIIVN